MTGIIDAPVNRIEDFIVNNMENQTDIKDRVSLVPWDYDNRTCFGYLLLKVKNGYRRKVIGSFLLRNTKGSVESYCHRYPTD